MPQAKKKSCGGALLTALFIMTLVAIVATAMSTRLQIDIYRTQLILNHDKLYLASQGVSYWALGELKDPKQKFTPINAKGVINEFPKKLTAVYPGVTLSGELYDLQSQYNLNNLSNRKNILGFMNLLNHVGLQLGEPQKLNLSLAINDWLSTYDLARGKDNYLSYYLKLSPPYNPSHQLMASSSELRLTKDMDAKTFLALKPWVTVLPETTPLNINTASKNSLFALSSMVTDSKAEELIAARGKKGFKDLGKVSALLKKMNIPMDMVTLESTYFLCVAQAQLEKQNLTVYSLLKRNKDKKGKIAVTIIRESFNLF